MSPAVTPAGATIRAVVALAILASALLLGGCVVVPARPGWAPGHYSWRG